MAHMVRIGSVVECGYAKKGVRSQTSLVWAWDMASLNKPGDEFGLLVRFMQAWWVLGFEMKQWGWFM